MNKDLVQAVSATDTPHCDQLHAVPAKTPLEHAKEIKAEGMQCCCDFDNWQPTPQTGHSPVCRIHKAAFDRYAKAMR